MQGSSAGLAVLEAQSTAKVCACALTHCNLFNIPHPQQLADAEKPRWHPCGYRRDSGMDGSEGCRSPQHPGGGGADACCLLQVFGLAHCLSSCCCEWHAEVSQQCRLACHLVDYTACAKSLVFQPARFNLANCLSMALHPQSMSSCLLHALTSIFLTVTCHVAG